VPNLLLVETFDRLPLYAFATDASGCQTIDNDGTVPGDLPFEFADLFAAVEEAKHVLAEMALDGLPQWPGGSCGCGWS
jgi:hypothetical protein